MTTQNQYSPQAITCEGGLDLVTPKLAAPSGSLADCINFEVGTRAGYTRVDGYERFDGRTSPSLAYTQLVCVKCVIADLSTAVTGQPVIDGDNKTIGYYTYSTSDEALGLFVWFVVTDYGLFLNLNTADTIKINAIVLTLSANPVSGVKGFKDFGVLTTYTVADQVDDLNDQYKLLRAKIGVVPCGNYYQGVSTKIAPPIGLHLFKDNVYAIQDMQQVYFNSGSDEVFSGDTIAYNGGAVTTVRDVQLISGTWAGGDAAGSFLTYDVNAAVGAAGITRPTTRINDAFTVVASPAAVQDTWKAGLFKSSSTGWQSVETGYNFEFDTGTNAPNTLNRGEVTQTNLLHGDTGGMLAGAISLDSAWTKSTWSGTPNAATKLEAIKDYNNIIPIHADTYDAYLIRSNTGDPFYDLSLDSFPDIANIPNGAKITGVEMYVRANAFDLFSSEGDFAQQKWSLSVIPSITGGDTKTLAMGLYDTDFTFGGDGDLFGLGTDPTALTSLGMKIRVSKEGSIVGAGTTQFYIDYAFLKIYYTQEVSEYYFWNGTDDVKAQIIDYYLTDPTDTSWEEGNAAGVMQVYTVTPVDTSDRRTIHVGDEIRSSPEGGGLQIAKVTSDMEFSGLAPISDLEDNNSRYQMITANFYGNKDWEAIYGVSGAGRGFSYDGFYLRYLYTGLSDDLDKPRHIAFHQHSLALGYDSGELTLSVVGEPNNFLGVDGAVTEDVGDKITGLLRMNGTTLGIFCEKSIHGLVGSSVNDFSIMVLVPYEGAIEYTVVDMGKPVYCSPRGISVFEQSDAYGDFLGNRLSRLITPWLLPRLQNTQPKIDNESVFSDGPKQGPVVALPVRSKNQYRLYFEDGYILTMTLVGLDLKPEFTFQKMWSYKTDGTYFKRIVPRAEYSGNDSHGKECIYLSQAYDSTISSFTTELGYVYSVDAGWTFDGEAIWGFVDINDNFFASPFEMDQIRKERLFGLSHGYFPLRTLITNDYGSLTLTAAKAAETSPVPLPREDNYPTWLLEDIESVTNITNTAKSGRSFSIKYYIPPVGDVMTATKALTVSPPGGIQTILIQHNLTKADV